MTDEFDRIRDYVLVPSTRTAGGPGRGSIRPRRCHGTRDRRRRSGLGPVHAMAPGRGSPPVATAGTQADSRPRVRRAPHCRRRRSHRRGPPGSFGPSHRQGSRHHRHSWCKLVADDVNVTVASGNYDMTYADTTTPPTNCTQEIGGAGQAVTGGNRCSRTPAGLLRRQLLLGHHRSRHRRHESLRHGDDRPGRPVGDDHAVRQRDRRVGDRWWRLRAGRAGPGRAGRTPLGVRRLGRGHRRPGGGGAGPAGSRQRHRVPRPRVHGDPGRAARRDGRGGRRPGHHLQALPDGSPGP